MPFPSPVRFIGFGMPIEHGGVRQGRVTGKRVVALLRNWSWFLPMTGADLRGHFWAKMAGEGVSPEKKVCYYGTYTESVAGIEYLSSTELQLLRCPIWTPPRLHCCP